MKVLTCGFCNNDSLMRCALCESPFCSDHGDQARELCDDCIKYEEIFKEGIMDEDDVF